MQLADVHGRVSAIALNRELSGVCDAGVFQDGLWELRAKEHRGERERRRSSALVSGVLRRLQ